MNPKIAHLVASIFFTGKLPIAPGTWGSLVALVIWYLTIPYISSITLIVTIVIILGLGVYTSSITEKYFKENDPSSVVIDEWVGQWIALLFIPQSVVWGVIAFALFRIFDIWKPYPIRKLDELDGGWGIMLDDVLAGVYSLIIIQVARGFLL